MHYLLNAAQVTRTFENSLGDGVRQRFCDRGFCLELTPPEVRREQTDDDEDELANRRPGFGASILHGFNIYPGSQLNFFDRANKGGHVAEVTISELP